MTAPRIHTSRPDKKHTPWVVVASPTDAEMCAVRGLYLVADLLPVEDARLIAAAPELLEVCMRATEEAKAGNGVRADTLNAMLDAIAKAAAPPRRIAGKKADCMSKVQAAKEARMT